MAINFPLNPTTGTQHTDGAYTWTYNGVAWVTTGPSLSVGPTGPSGPQGVTGPTGAGVTGATGVHGVTGVTGATGPAGTGGGGGAGGIVVAEAFGRTLTELDNGNTFTNEGALTLISLVLPPAVQGYGFTFIVQDPNGLAIVADPADIINLAGLTFNGIESVLVGSTVSLRAVNATEWIATALLGTWSESSTTPGGGTPGRFFNTRYFQSNYFAPRYFA